MLPLQMVQDPATQQNFDAIQRAWDTEPVYRGTGSPAGVVTAGPGAEYINLATGDLWVHAASTVSSAGWVLVSGSRCGAGSIAFAGAQSVTGTVTHGLGVTPTHVDMTQRDDQATAPPITYQCYSATSTQWTFRAYSYLGVYGGTNNYSWAAMV